MTDERITAYLLQELTEEEAKRLEEQCFAQEEWPAHLDSVELELIDSYLRNQLSTARRQRFEKNYLTTDARKARVLMAESFLQLLCPAPSLKLTFREKLQAFWQRPLVPQTAVAILILAIGLSLVFALMRGGQSPRTFAHLYVAASSSDRATGVQAATVTLPLSTDALEIHLKLSEQSPDTVGYRVRWENVKGTLGEDLKIESQDAQSVTVIIPADELSPGQYILKLFRTDRGGTERVSGNYYFTAEEAR